MSGQIDKKYINEASLYCYRQIDVYQSICFRIPYADKITPEPILHNNARDTKADSIRNSYNSQFKVGIYGWRKKCLYILVMALMFMMIINLALTLWVLKVLDFNSVSFFRIAIRKVICFVNLCFYNKNVLFFLILLFEVEL